MATLITSSPRSKLIYDQELEEEEFSTSLPNKPSYYKRSHLLIHTQSTSSFREKYKGFRARSSSYTSLDDEKKLAPIKDDNITSPVATNNSMFSRKNIGIMTAAAAAERKRSSPFSVVNKKNDFYDEEKRAYINDYEENISFAKDNNNNSDMARKNLHHARSNTIMSWKSCVLRAVGVKNR